VSPYTAFCSRVAFPLHELLKGHTSVTVRRRLEASQWWTREQLAHWQVVRLREFLIEIGTHVPYYRRTFKELGFDPAQLQSTGTLQRLPMLRKQDIRTHGKELHADDHGPLKCSNTGGSTGEPLTFYMGLDRISHDVGAKWRATRWWDVDIGDKEVVLWGSPIELGSQDRIRRLRDGLMRSHLVPAFDMSEKRLDQFVQFVSRVQPRMLFGYPSALALLARHAEQRGFAMSALGIRVAFVTSERLYDDQRATIERVFGCRVANGYGGRDAGFVAHECPSGGMHLMAEDIIVELVDGEGHVVRDGEPGEIVVTHLASRDFPFLRYRTGDVAIADNRECACGRGLPLLREIQGRTTDFVVAADGTVMHGLSLIYILREQAGIRSFKVTQLTRHKTEVLLVVEPGFDRGAVFSIQTGFRRRLGAEVEIQVRIVDDIPAERSGKYRYIVSHALAPAEARSNA
jgi:phenylacetate-CoA ligase